MNASIQKGLREQVRSFTLVSSSIRPITRETSEAYPLLFSSLGIGLFYAVKQS